MSVVLLWEMKKIFQFILFFLVFDTTFCQEYVYQNFTTKDGLPSNQVYDIYQDENGYLWFATDRGIARYDGYEFVSFDLQDGLTDHTIFKFFPQKNGEIWCSTFRNHLFYFNTGDYQFKTYPYNENLAKLAANYVILDLKKDSVNLTVSFKNRLGIISINSKGEILSDLINSKPLASLGLFYNPKEKFAYKGEIGLNKGKLLYQEFKFGHHAEVEYLRGGYVLFLGGDRVALKDSNNSLVKMIKEDNKPLSIGHFSNELFYIGYENEGFKLYNYDGELITTHLFGLSGVKIFEDHEGGVWFSSINSGVFYVSNKNIKRSGIDDKHILSLAKDSKRNLWVSTFSRNLYSGNQKKGFYKRGDNSLVPFRPLSYNDPYLNYDWVDYAQIKLGNNSYASIRGGLCFDVEKNKPIEKLITDSSFYPLSNGRENDFAINDDRHILVGNRGVRLFIEDSLIKDTHQLLDTRVEDVEVVNGVEFYSTLGKGLVVLKDDSAFLINESKGLISNVINKTYSEGDSVIWVCTNAGLNKMTLNRDGFMIEKKTILENYDITDVEIIDTMIWIGTRKGLFSYPKYKFTESDGIVDYFRLLYVDVNGVVKRREELKDLNYKQNEVVVGFKAISFNSNDKLLYRFKFENDDQWKYTKETKIILPNLSPDNYKLTVQASIDNESWSKEIHVYFRITPPFYSTILFKFFIFIFILLVIYWFFRVRVLIYNRDVVRELIRLTIKKIKQSEKSIVIRESGKDVKINTGAILFVKSSGNYLEFHTEKGLNMYREKMSNFFKLVPDPLEYVQIHRSYIVRIDQVSAKSKDSVVIKDMEFKVTKTFQKNLAKIQL